MTQAYPALANPKPAKSGSTGRSCWYRFYAMFSEQFAEEVLQAASLPAGAVILDPWLGVGTTTAVAARAGYHAVGVDVNPVMVSVATGRCIDKMTATALVETIARASRTLKYAPLPKDDPLLAWFGKSAAASLRAWDRIIRDLHPGESHPVRAGFLHTVLFEAAWKLAAPYRAKNPTWVKQPSADNRTDCPAQEITNTVLSFARKKAAECLVGEAKSPRIQLGTSTRLDGLPAKHADFVLTSPPYCTRIDYAVSTRIELAVLGYDNAAVGALRDATMGTSTIRGGEVKPNEAWGRGCNDLLATILNHPSKSSANYYYKTFVQYFADLHASLGEIGRCVKPGAGVVIVVQDSHYKGTLVDLAGIVAEMAVGMGWEEVRRDDYGVSQTMRRVNTRSRRYRDDATSVESVLWYRTPTGGAK